MVEHNNRKSIIASETTNNDEAKLRKSPRLKLEKGKNKVNSDDDDDFVEIHKVKRLIQTQMNFKTLEQNEVVVVNEKGMSAKKPGKSRALNKPGMPISCVSLIKVWTKLNEFLLVVTCDQNQCNEFLHNQLVHV